MRVFRPIMCPMKYNPQIHHRRSIRLSGYGYSLAGWYFITICTHQRQPILSHPLIRNFVYNAWHDLPRRFPSICLDEFVIMPNHVHGIIRILNRIPVGAQRDTKPEHVPPAHPTSKTERVPTCDQAAPLRPAVAPRSLGVIARALKSVAAKRINRLRGTPGAPVWQRNYGACPERSRRERVIRNEEELNAIRQYIRDNPAKWAEDKNNPANWHNQP